MLDKFILLFCLVTLAVTQMNEDILFTIPDIQTTYKLENGYEVTLIAYKTKETDELISLAQKENRVLNVKEISRINWMTAGTCSFVPNRIFYRSSHIEIGLSCLNDHIRTHLARKASEKHHINVTPAQILLLPFTQVKCRADVIDPVTRAEVSLFGQVKTFKRSPLRLEISSRENSLERTTFRHLQNAGEPIDFDCELFANGKTESKNELKINFRETSMAEVVDRVLGGANSTFVTRQQMGQLSQEIYTSLNIEEVYEMPELTFSETFVKDFINLAATQTFHKESMKQALAHLSKYSIDFSADLTPDVITRDVKSIFAVNDTGSEVKVLLDSEAYDKFKSKYGNTFSDANSDSFSHAQGTSSSSGGSAGFSFLGLFSIGASGSSGNSQASSNSRSSRRQSSGSKKNETSKVISNKKLNENLKKLSSRIVSQVNFVVEGRRIVPKTLMVAKLLRANIKREMKFSRIRKTLHKAPFHEIVRVVLNDVTTVNLTPYSLQLIEKLNASLSLQVDKQEISSNVLIDKLNTSMAAFQTETGNAFGKINTTFSKQMEAMYKLNATIKAFKETIEQLKTNASLSYCQCKESVSDFFPTTTQLASNSSFQVFQEASLQYIPTTIIPPTVNNLMQTLVSSVNSSIVAQASLTVMAGDYVEINAIIPYETNGNDEDVNLVFFTSGPSTPNGYYDLAMPNYPRAVGGLLFGTSAIKTSGGLGLAGRLMIFEATGPYKDDKFDSTMERLIGHSIWKAPMAGTYTFVAVMCTGASRSMTINAPWGRALKDANNEFGYSTFFVKNLATSLPWSVAQQPAQFYIPNTPVAPTMTAKMQTLITSISGSIVAQTMLTVNAGDYVKINAKVPYETNSNEYNVDLIFYTSGPTTAANFYDLAMPNYPQFVGGPLFGTASIKTTGDLGAPGQLMMFDSTGPYNDPDFNSTPEQLNGHAIWKAPESGNFTFYAVVTTGSTSRAIRINSVWNIAPITPEYEYGYTNFLVQVQDPKQISFYQSNTNTLYTGLLPPILTGAMQALSTSISTNIVANASLTLSHGQLVRITGSFPYETNGNDHDVDLIIFTQGPTTQNRYYDLASVNYVRDAWLGTTFGTESIRTIYSGVMLGQLLTYDCNGRYNDPGFSDTPQKLQMSAIWKAPTSGTHNFYAVITTGGNAAYKFRLNSPWNSLGADANYEYGYSLFQVEILT